MPPLTRRSILAGAAAAPLLQAQSRAPNILLVLSDDHSAPYFGAGGSSWLSTPNLDRFASESLRFERAFTAAPQCVPSRAALMTGRSPVAARMGRFNSPLPIDVSTLPELLRAKKYFTGVAGRYFHLNGTGQAGPLVKSIYAKHQLETWDKRVDVLDRQAPDNESHAKLGEFVGSAGKDRPWFFWMNYRDPHHPWQNDTRTIDPARVTVPPHLPDLPGVREDLARYGAEIERMDGFFGRTLDLLKSRGLEENTVVVFMGDNGMAFPHGKGSLYDPGLNVPLMVRWPGRIKPGATRSLVSGEDLTPTLLELGGATGIKQMTGVSFAPLLLGRAHQPRKHIFAARLHHGNAPFTANTKASGFDLSRCARNDRFKYIYNCTPQMEYAPVDSARDPGWTQMVAANTAGKLKPEHARAYFGQPRPVHELYDLDNDPGELVNLSGDPEHKAVQRELMEALTEKMTIDFDFLPPPLNE